MSHLSDFSYVDRGLTMLLVFLWILFRVLSEGSIADLNIFKKSNRSLKVTATYLIIISSLSMIFYDSILSYVKYEEGYMYFNKTGEILTKPKAYWSEENQGLLPITGVLINIGFTFKSSAHFLTLAFFNSIATFAVGQTFMTSLEFKAYRVYAIFSIVMYPLLQFLFADDPLLTVVMPQLWYHFECLAIMALTIFTNCRLKGLRSTSKSMDVVSTLSYYIEINYYLVFFVALEFIGLGSINFDLLEEPHHLKENKLSQDCFTHLFDIGMPLALGGMIMLLYRPKGYACRNFNRFGTEGVTTAATSKTNKTANSSRLSEASHESLLFFDQATSFCKKFEFVFSLRSSARKSSDSDEIELRTMSSRDLDIEISRRIKSFFTILEEFPSDARKIYDRFLSTESPTHIKLSSDTLRLFEEAGFGKDGSLNEKTTLSAMEEARKEVFIFSRLDAFRQLTDTKSYAEYVSNRERKHKLRMYDTEDSSGRAYISLKIEPS